MFLSLIPETNKDIRVYFYDLYDNQFIGILTFFIFWILQHMALDSEEVELLCKFSNSNQDFTDLLLSQTDSYKATYASDYFIRNKQSAMSILKTHLSGDKYEKYEKPSNGAELDISLYDMYGRNFVNAEMKKYSSFDELQSSSNNNEKYEKMKKSIKGYINIIQKNNGDLDNMKFASALPDLTNWTENDYSDDDFGSLMDEYKAYKKGGKDLKTSVRVYKSNKMKKKSSLGSLISNYEKYIQTLETIIEEKEKKKEEEKKKEVIEEEEEVIEEEEIKIKSQTTPSRKTTENTLPESTEKLSKSIFKKSTPETKTVTRKSRTRKQTVDDIDLSE